MMYRGIEYQTPAACAIASSTPAVGKYRGSDTRLGLPQDSAPNAAIPLRYRGVQYLTAR